MFTRMSPFQFRDIPIVRLSLLLLAALLATPDRSFAADEPKAGSPAPDFALDALGGGSIRLSNLTAKETVVLVVLRGWPGYQCPNCDRQVNDFIGSAAAFAEAKARVVFVYPGPAEALQAHAQEFRGLKGREWPADFVFVLDPDFSMINAYGLRWNAPRESAYPATFIIGQNNTIRFAKVSRTHGDRSTAAEILAQLK
jgi:thioredoxin-dependent peroxiredoxin